MVAKFKQPPKAFMTSRMFNGPTRRRFRTFKVGFADTARKNNGPLLGRIDAAEKRITAASARLRFTEEQLQEAKEQLQEAKSEEETAIAESQSLNDTMTDCVLGPTDPMVIMWNDTMAMTRLNEQHQQKNFEELMEKRLQKVTNWKKLSHGDLRSGEHHAKAMIVLSVHFYPHKFNMKEYASMFALSTVSHNMVVAIEILLQENIMEESKNKLEETVYGLVASISSNIDYRDQDEDVIDEEFIRMIAEGNREASDNKAKRKRRHSSQRDANNTDSNVDNPFILNV